MLLEIVAIVLTAIIRIVQALLVAFAPMIYSFFRLVLPFLLKLFPVVFEVVGVLATLLTSDPVKRIFDFLLQALPIVIDIIGILVCQVGIYLGSVACYIVYAIAVTLGFYVKYFLRPYICGLGAFYGGCLENFVLSMLDTAECYTCGQYNTACGCRKATYPENGCGSDCVEEGSGLIIPAPPPTASAPVPSTFRATQNATGRGVNYAEDDTNPSNKWPATPRVQRKLPPGTAKMTPMCHPAETPTSWEFR